MPYGIPNCVVYDEHAFRFLIGRVVMGGAGLGSRMGGLGMGPMLGIQTNGCSSVEFITTYV